MSKSKEVSQLLKDISEYGSRLTHALTELSECTNGIVTAIQTYADTGVTPEKATAKEAPVAVQTQPAEKPSESKTYTKEQVRAALSGKSSENNGRYRAQVKALVKKYANGGSLTNVDPKDYAALIAETEGLKDA